MKSTIEEKLRQNAEKIAKCNAKTEIFEHPVPLSTNNKEIGIPLTQFREAIEAHSERESLSRERHELIQKKNYL